MLTQECLKNIRFKCSIWIFYEDRDSPIRLGKNQINVMRFVNRLFAIPTAFRLIFLEENHWKEESVFHKVIAGLGCESPY